MKKINKISMVVFKIIEIVHWIGVVSMVAWGAIALTGKTGIFEALKKAVDNGEFSIATYALETTIVDDAGALNLQAIALFAVGSAIILSLAAMIFRNAYLIIKNSRGATPFQKDNIRMVREIGVFAVSIPAAAVLTSVIMRLVVGDGVETSVRFDLIPIGIVALALTNVFSYGAKLQEDVDGLL